MRDVFICHAEEDGAIATTVAAGLREAGFTTWCYEEDSDPGPTYLRQVDEELGATQAVVVLISPDALRSSTVVNEIVRAHEARKPFVPLRLGVSHERVQQQPEFRMTLGASVSLAIDHASVPDVLVRVVRGLERLGVERGGASAGGKGDPARREVLRPQPRPAPVGETLLQRATRAIDGTSERTRLAITSVVGGLGVLAAVQNLLHALNPDRDTATLYRLVPNIGTANLLANLAGLALNGVLLYTVWQIYTRRAPLGDRVRSVATLMLQLTAIWLVVVLFSALFPPDGRLRGPERVAVIQASLMMAALAAGPAALVRALFRR